MEMATSIDLVNNPLHPYTIGLMDSVPDMGKEGQKLTAIPGELPNLAELGNGLCFIAVAVRRCRFAKNKARAGESRH